MKISERKQHLRMRGVVPLSQETVRRSKAASAPSQKRTGTAKGVAPAKGGSAATPRARWQPSAGYQMAFGVAYMVFSPILIAQAVIGLRSPNPKNHPDMFALILPVIFFLFGAWWFYRGLQARRRQRVTAGETPATGKAALDRGAS